MKDLFKQLNLEEILNIEKVDSSQNSVYKVTTKENNYLVKEYSDNAISNKEDLITRTKQINISEYLNNSGIKTILPIKFNNEIFINYNNKYYLIYNYLNYKTLNRDELNNTYMKILANTLASIHKLKLNIDLPIQYKTINLDLTSYINKINNNPLYKDLYNLLLNTSSKLTQLINDCNNSISRIKEDLCISHNDYKLKNILFNEYDIYLIDFDASSLSNPIVSLAESAFALSIQKKEINYNLYKTYIREYLDTYGEPNTSFNDALNCAMNGKLQWLCFLLGEAIKNNETRINDSISMINELMIFINNKDKLLDTYNKLNYIIRKKEIKDCAAVEKITTICWQSTYRGIINDPFLDFIATNEEERTNNAIATIDRTDKITYVLELNNNVIGFTILGKSSYNEYNDIGEIFALYILPEYQHLGYGNALVQKGLHELHKLGYKNAIIGCLSKNKSNEFYKRIGGKLIGTRPFLKTMDNLEENIYLFNIEE